MGGPAAASVEETVDRKRFADDGVCMMVEVRNLQTGETYEVGGEGAIFGREGGQANIQVQDRSVSKRHARIFSDGVDWFLEDMGSVNGTVVDGGKIAAAIPLFSGLTFSLSKHKFEVLGVPGEDRRSSPEQETRTAMRQSGNQLPSELRKDPIPRKRGRDARPVDDDIAPPMGMPEPSARGNNLPLAADGDFPSESIQSASMGNRDQGPAPSLGIDQYDEYSPGEALTTGIGYILKTAPLLALNPIGTVRNQLQNQPLPGLEKIPLAMLLVPTYIVMLTLQSGSGAVATAIAGNLSIVSIILAPVIGIVGGAIGAVIAGFLAHPILNWFVLKLGGASDARSRTNHVALGMVAVFVAAIPTMIAVVLTAIIGRLAQISSAFHLLQILPALLMLVATPLPIYVQWQWWKSYGIAKWAQTVLMVLTILTLVLGLFGCVSSMIGAVKAMSGGATISAPDTDGGDTDGDGDGDKGDDAGDKGEKGDDGKGADAKADGKADGAKADGKVDPKADGKVDPKAADTKAAVKSGVATVRVNDDYAAYAKKRAEIEEILERDPTLVNNPRVRSLYDTLLQRTDDAEIEVFRNFGSRKRPSYQNPLYDKAKKALVFERTNNDVIKLHGVLF